jgi:hypothetical protein
MSTRGILTGQGDIGPGYKPLTHDINWSVFQGLIYQVTAGKITRSRFVAEWAAVQREQGIQVKPWVKKQRA